MHFDNSFIPNSVLPIASIIFDAAPIICSTFLSIYQSPLIITPRYTGCMIVIASSLGSKHLRDLGWVPILHIVSKAKVSLSIQGWRE